MNNPQINDHDVNLWNPLPRDVVTTYDINENHEPVEYICKAESISTFPFVIGNHMRKLLVDEILNHRNLPHYDYEREQVRLEVTK